MFTSYDKAIASLVMAALYLAKNLLGINLGLSPEMEGQLAMFITALAVWLIPNKGEPPAGGGSLTR